MSRRWALSVSFALEEPSEQRKAMAEHEAGPQRRIRVCTLSARVFAGCCGHCLVRAQRRERMTLLPAATVCTRLAPDACGFTCAHQCIYHGLQQHTLATCAMMFFEMFVRRTMHAPCVS